MLDQGVSNVVNNDLWQSIPVRVELPTNDFGGPSTQGRGYGSGGDMQRSHNRSAVDLKAVIRNGDEWLAGYVKDLSAGGIAVLAPYQLFPKQRVIVWIFDQPPLDVLIHRCRRRGAKCYMSGGVFATGPLPPARLQQLITLTAAGHSR